MSFQFKTIAGRNSKHTYLMSETICNSINCTTAIDCRFNTTSNWCPSLTISITLKIPSFSTTVPDAVPRSLQLVEEDKTVSIPSLNIDFILFLLQDPGFEETNQGNGGGKVGPTFRLLACREISTMKFNAIKLFCRHWFGWKLRIYWRPPKRVLLKNFDALFMALIQLIKIKRNLTQTQV